MLNARGFMVKLYLGVAYFSQVCSRSLLYVKLSANSTG